jgi:nitrite reductase/ring-hydroxylating ferredoxin subunit
VGVTELQREYFVGTLADFSDGSRRLITVDGVEVGVISHRGRFYAYRNWCVHQGGPVCEGLITGRVQELVDDDGRIVGGSISEEEIRIVCPWHGYEFDLETGRCIPESNKRLRAYEVVERDGNVYVVV